ncbi:MAG: T9SS type A sorting domain-containing protein [Bacteroidetes bacterium]|nr:T9SS type A sorting domain-containing protein [Bacteroidota bacterium]
MKIKLLLAFISFNSIMINAQINYVLDFNGTSDYVNLGNSAATDIRSVEFWFRPDVNISSSISDQSYALIGRNDATQLKEFGFLIRGSEFSSGRGRLNFYMSNNGSYYDLLSNDSSWVAGTWYHVCGTIDAVNGMKLYINGVQQTITNPYNAAIPPASEITTLGRWGDLSMRYFPGKMDEVRFWNRTLLQPEIADKMCYWLVPANETGLVGYWKMNEGSGSVIADSSPASNDGALMGAVFIQDTVCFSGYLGTPDEYTADAKIAVYPNPASSSVTVNCSNGLNGTNITIYNAIGQPVKYFEGVTGGSFTIALDDLACGIYYIRVAQSGIIIATEKLVIADNQGHF